MTSREETRMHDQPDERPLHREVTVDELVRHHARIAGDIVEIDARTWAIHGFIPVDGEVILAEFERRDLARAVLDRLPRTEGTNGGIG
jgi:hypothetical protein